MQGKHRRWTLMTIVAATLSGVGANAQEAKSVLAPGAKLTKAGDGFQFTEGPAVDAEGNVYFTDIPANCIHKWSLDGKITTYRENSGGANGLFFDTEGNLLACEGGNGRVVSIDPKGEVTPLADKYDGKHLNSPNDLWIDPKGGVYFSDPKYGRGEKTQDGEHVYYVTPDRKRIIRVVDDMTRPNGLIGTPDGKLLYIADHGAGKTFRYHVNADGTLTGKTLFAESGSDGMTMDEEGNLYLTAEGVLVFDATGKRIATIEIPERPANLTFGGADRKTLFITARGSVYTLQMRVAGSASN